MFRVINFKLLMRYTMITTIILSLLLYTLVQNIWFPNLSFWKIFTISSVISSILIFILSSSFFSRKIWKIFAIFNKSLFPDLNGAWDGIITTEEGKEFQIRAIIRQSLLSTEIDIHGETVKSITLESTPIVEKGQKKLYYMYFATSKNVLWSSYNGSTLFDIRNIDDTLELSGQYYTNRKTIGRISLKQIDSNTNRDVSFY